MLKRNVLHRAIRKSCIYYNNFIGIVQQLFDIDKLPVNGLSSTGPGPVVNKNTVVMQ